MELIGNYNVRLVAVSVIAAMLASMVALSIVPRIGSADNGKRVLIWVTAFGLSLGAGIWTMHFVAMLAFRLPVPVQYEPGLTTLSLLIAITASAIAIAPLRSGGTMHLKSVRTLAMGLMLGLAISAMHYTGMAAMRLDATIHYDGWVVVLSVIIAAVAATAALLIANHLRDQGIFRQLHIKALSAVIMGLAVSAMHYTAMYGTHFVASKPHLHHQELISPEILAVFVVVVALLAQGGIIVTAILDEAYVVARASEAAVRRRAEMNQMISRILEVGLQKLSLKETLAKVLENILASDLLNVEQCASIFLADGQRLRMVVQQNMHDELCRICAEIDYGECLCGNAAAQGRVIFKDHVDADHTHGFAGMQDHGHVCIPVKSGDRLLAVINLYVRPGYHPAAEERSFLATLADAVAGIIESRRLEERANKISVAIDQAGEAVQITDHTGTIEYVNRAFCDVSGYAEAELLGRKSSILNSSEQNESSYHRQIWQAITAGEVWKGELVERRKDGSTYPAMLTISPIRGSDGAITHYVAILEDLSEHKRLERQIRQAQKMEALGTLVGGIAHEFNNMLASILGNLFLLKKQLHDRPDAQAKIDRVERVGFDAADMIKRMLAFSRSEGVEMQPLSLTAFIKEAFALHQVGVPENIRIRKQLSSHPLSISGNPTQLQQVLLNLLGNAIDAVKGRVDPTIEIITELFEADDRFLAAHPKCRSDRFAHIIIRDNGVGIEAADIEHVFDPFFSTKGVGEGTGLGLSISASIVRAHHGVIDIDSTPGKGTSVHIYLPLRSSDVQLDAVSGPEEVVPEGDEAILLVDDDANVRSTISEALSEMGYVVQTAVNGAEAIAMCQDKAFDLVILDVVMPEMGGPEAAKVILKQHPDMRILFVTGYDRDAALGEEGTFDGMPVLHKPFDIEKLHRTIRLLLN